MNFFLCGVNHTTADLTLRERFAANTQRLADLLQDAAQHPDIHEVMFLSTCNRCEFYCFAEHAEAPVQWLSDYHQLPFEQYQQHFYRYSGQAALEHAIRVTSGLDSMLLGEPQIFGQVKSALQQASELGVIGPRLAHLFQHVFTITKRVRTETAVGAHAVSIGSAAVQLAECIFSDFSALNVLFIGAGETIQLAAQHFAENQVASMVVANRTLSHAQTLAQQWGAKAIDFSQLDAALAKADIIVSATQSEQPIITRSQFENALKQGPVRPVFLIDLAVPRDIDEAIGRLDGVYLYNIDDLQRITQEGLSKRQEAAQQAIQFIRDEALSYVNKLIHGDFTETILAYRQKVELLREQEVAKALRALQSGKPAEQVLKSMARSLTNKVMHQPSVELQQAGSKGHREFLTVAKRLFGIHEKEPSKQ